MKELARTGGLEPPPPGFVVRHIVQFCYVRRLERPTGFEPAFPSLRGWCPALDDDRELAPAAGFEPASFSVNSRARSPGVLDRNRLVEKPGVEPGTSILQGSTAARRLPHLPDREIIQRMRASSDKCFPSGNARYMLPRVADNGGARDSNRTNLFCSSGRRVDHDHYTGALERPVGNRTHRPHVGNVVLCH